MVFGSSRGDITNPHSRDNYMAWVNNATVTIGTEGGTYASPTVKGSVYGSGENGHTFGNTVVTVNSGTVGVPSGDPVKVPDPDDPSKTTTYYGANYPFRGNVYGGGCGTDTYKENGEVKYNPEAGIVRGNTTVNINGGLIAHSVYGAGSMGSVGTITKSVEHANANDGFALSWPYEFTFADNTGKATVNINGGHIGVQTTVGNIEIKGDGDVYGSARGEAGDRYAMARLALVKETEVNVNYSSTADMADVTDLSTPCITGSVHGSGENGYVYGDTYVTLNKGLVGHSLYGAGKGNGTYTKSLLKIGATEGSTNPKDYYDADIYSLLAGRVMGNTYVTMNDGHVGRNVYGGGNMGSVGKGNYAGGADDYYPAGYGEKITGNLWTSAFNPEVAISESNKPDDAYYFLSSGKATVKVLGGIVGYINKANPTASTKGLLPYGNVFGGSAGEAAPNIAEDPRYLYSPAFFSGYVNETDVTIGTSGQETDADAGQTGKAPRILGSVYGGGQDGHVRRDAKVTVYSGEIGLPFTLANQELLQTTDPNSEQWLHRGNVYGAGSGISKYQYDFNYDNDVKDTNVAYDTDPTGAPIYANEEDYSSSSGSVTRFTKVDIKGGIIHRNVYGGGSMGSVGAPKITQDYYPYKKGDTASEHGPGKQSQCTVNISGTIGSPEYNSAYGGNVFGAGRGIFELKEKEEDFSYTIWTKVNILNGAVIKGDVFGGGDNGMVKEDADVRIGDLTAE
jgi:hypothetical protein